MEYTKGEWKLEKRLNSKMPYGLFRSQGVETTTIAFVKNIHDAHLIAQAPKLYEALDTIIAHLRKLDKLYSKDLEILNIGAEVLAKVGSK